MTRSIAPTRWSTTFQRLGIDALIAIGGDGSLRIASPLR